MRLSFIICLAALTGCALPADVWNKPGAGQQEFQRDSSDCEEQAKMDNPAAGPTTGSNTKAAYEICMKDLGYTKQGETPNHHVRNGTPGVLSPIPVSQ